MQHSQSNRYRDVYQLVTDRIIALLEKGTVPWRQPWTGAGIPRNLVSRRPYTGINVLLLSSLGYAQNQFLSFKQVHDLGGRVRKGERAHIAVFVKRVQLEAKEGKEPTQMALLRYYTVFNVAQCDGLPADRIVPTLFPSAPIRSCERVIRGMPHPPEIRHAGDQAFYSPADDTITMPRKASFGRPEHYYATLFHELVHSTGHSSRLGRGKDDGTGSKAEAYALEELVAELGACYLKSFSGIGNEPLDNHAAYIAHWLGRLRQDRRLLVRAGSLAQRAVDYILARKGNIPAGGTQKMGAS